MCQFYMLLSYSEERVEVAVLPHKLVKAAALVHTAVLKHQNAVIAAQQRLLQRGITVRDAAFKQGYLQIVDAGANSS